MSTKWDRIQKVKSLGLNTENSVLIDDPKNWKAADTFIRQHNMFSVRSFYKDPEDRRVAPHWPVVGRSELLELILIAKRERLDLIVAECIDPKDCLFAGAALKRDIDGYSNLHIEIARGPGTVRRVTNDGLIDVIYSYQERSLRINTALHPLATATEQEKQRVYCCARAMDRILEDDVVFEFSYYNVPVGYMAQHFIVWEVTPADRR